MVRRAKGGPFAVQSFFILGALTPSLGLAVSVRRLPLSIGPRRGISLTSVGHLLHRACRKAR